MSRKKKVEETEAIEQVIEEVKEEVKEKKKPAEKKDNKTIVEVIKPRVNIRKTPSLLGEVLGVVTEGERLELLDKYPNGGFYFINWNGVYAYILADLVK